MTGYRVYQATPVQFQIDLNITHNYTETYKYVGASINITIPCDWAAAFDAVASKTDGTEKRHPEVYRKSLEGFYNLNAQVKVAWGNAIDQIIASTMQELITMKQNILLSLGGATSERASMKLTAASNLDSYSLNINKVAENMAYVPNVWVSSDKVNEAKNFLKRKIALPADGGDDLAECPGVTDAAQYQSATDSSTVESGNLSNLGMLVNNTNVKEVMNKLCADGAFGCYGGKGAEQSAGEQRIIAPEDAALTAFNVPVLTPMMIPNPGTDPLPTDYLIDIEDRLIFPCDLTAVYYDSTDSSTSSTANNIINEPIQNIPDFVRGPNTYSVTWADQVVYDVNIIFKQSVKHASDNTTGHPNVGANVELDESDAGLTEGPGGDSSNFSHTAGQQIEQDTTDAVSVAEDGTVTASGAATSQDAAAAGAELLDSSGNANADTGA
jgi:hypothetical protein